MDTMKTVVGKMAIAVVAAHAALVVAAASCHRRCRRRIADAIVAATAWDDTLVAPWASGGSGGGPNKILQTLPSVDSGWTSGDLEPCDSTVRAASAYLAACMAALGLPLVPRLPASDTLPMFARPLLL